MDSSRFTDRGFGSRRGLGSLVRSAILLGVFLLGVLSGTVLRPSPEVPSPASGETLEERAPRLRTGPRPEPPAGPTVSAPAGADDGIVRFAFYNLKNYLPMRRSVDGETRADAPKPEEEIQVVIDSLADVRPDILGVCEIGGEEDVADLRRRLRERGMGFPELEWVDGADEERHLALLSRFPIIARHSQVDLTYRLGDREFPVQRGFLDVTIQVDEDYQLRCIGVHFKSKREVPEGDQALMRRNEARLLREHVDAIQADDPDANLLVYGDFNDTRNEAPIRAIQGRFGSDRYLGSIYLKDSLGMAWTHHWSYANLYSRIDFIFHNQALYPEIIEERSFLLFREDWEEGSDHRLLVAAIRSEDVKR